MIETERLRLRAWRPTDAVALHSIRCDPRVAATLGAPPSLARCEGTVERQAGHLVRHGYCFWAAERRDDERMVGWCGLQPGKPPIEGEVEIGWTLASDLWGRGLATEAADAVLGWAWANTDLPRITAITAEVNARSRALMDRLGMMRCPDRDFDHPDLSDGDPLRRHVTYAIARSQGVGTLAPSAVIRADSRSASLPTRSRTSSSVA